MTNTQMNATEPLANDYTTILESPNPDTIWSCSPGVCRLDNGRLVATTGLRGPGMKKRNQDPSVPYEWYVFISDDGGATWKKTATYPFQQARPFEAGGKLYVIGCDDDLYIIASEDDGETWSEPVKLSQGERWHQAPANVLYANGCVYLVMERKIYDDCKAWEPSVLAPALMRAPVDADLTKKDSWTFASEIAFRDVFTKEDLIEQGRVLYPFKSKRDVELAPDRKFAPPGWLETNVFKIYDEDHYWYDPEAKTIHLVARLHTGLTNYAALLKVTEQGDKPGTGEMVTGFETLPSGAEYRLMPLPGGHIKFHILYDEETKLYWLVSSQSTDSMTRPERLDEERYNLPYNQRSRLALYYSKNMVDWCYAGLVAKGESERESRHYASMVIDGDDLVILSRSGDSRSNSAHNGDLVTCHRVKDFRSLSDI